MHIVEVLHRRFISIIQQPSYWLLNSLALLLGTSRDTEINNRLHIPEQDPTFPCYSDELKASITSHVG